MLTTKQIKTFQKEILEWYKKNKRDLPWRHSREPYSILISEVMAQQTQLSRVIPKYLEWMKKFPTLESLANASFRDILSVWSGLGYNRRALYLQKLTQEIVKNHNGEFPQTKEELKKLPGIGEYTAGAILCFAFNKQVAVVDTNVRKVILTQLHISNEKDIPKIADELLPKGKAYEWNQALMDYAAAMLKQHKIPIPKQSHFKTSNRFYRGQMMRLLLVHTKASADSLFTKMENNGITKEQFENILLQMQKEGLIQKKGKYVLLP